MNFVSAMHQKRFSGELTERVERNALIHCPVPLQTPPLLAFYPGDTIGTGRL
jgi:hypothetical protein